MLLCFGKDCCASGKFLVFWKRLLRSRIDCCVLEKIVVFSKRLLCSRKDCCVLKKIVVLSKRLLCCPKDCCVLQKIVVFQNRNWVVFCPYGPPYFLLKKRKAFRTRNSVQLVSVCITFIAQKVECETLIFHHYKGIICSTKLSDDSNLDE